MADIVISVDIDATGTKKGTAEVKRDIKGIGEATEKTGRQARSVASQDMKALEESLKAAAIQGEVLGNFIGKAFDMILSGAVRVIQAIGNITTAWAKAGTAIGKAQQLTGMSAESLSALEMQARRTGTSFDELGEGFKNFTKLIGDANNGQTEAIAKVNRLGLDYKKAAADIDGAYRQILQKIVELKLPAEQANAAMDAFGENGYKLLPFIQSFKGDMNGLIEKARELGVLMSGDDVQAAKSLQNAFVDLDEAVLGVTRTFAKEYGPTVKEVLDSTRTWLISNKDTINDWAVYTADLIQGVANAWVAAKNAAEYYFGTDGFKSSDTSRKYGLGDILSGGLPFLLAESGAATRQTQKMQDALSKMRSDNTFDFSYPDKVASPAPKYFDGATKAAKSAKKQAARSTVPKLTDDQKQAQDLAKQIKDLQIELNFFGQTSNEAAMREELLKKGIFRVNQGLAAQLIQLAKNKDQKEAAAEATKKTAAAEKSYLETLDKIRQAGADDRGSLSGEIAKLNTQISLGRELNTVEVATIDNKQALLDLQRQLEAGSQSAQEISMIIQATREQQNLTLQLIKQRQSLMDVIEAKRLASEMTGSLDAEIMDLNVQLGLSAELSRADAVAKQLQGETYKKLDQATRDSIVAKAEEVDRLRELAKAQQEAQRQYDQTFNTIRDSLQVLADQGFGAFFKNVSKKFQAFLLDMVAQWLTSKFFQLFYKGGNTQTAVQNGQQGGILGGLFQGIFGQGGGSGQGPGGTPNFNPGASGGGVPPTGTITIGPNGEPMYTVNGNQSAPFSLFGGGLTNGIGTIASLGMMAGGAIGGKFGGLISSVSGGALTGLMLGAKLGMIGGPVGAAIGAAAGFAMSILGGLFSSPKRKRDKNEKMPLLTQGFADALKQLRMLRDDKNAILSNPSGAMAKADELRAAIASGFGIQFESKKYSKIAQQQIAQKLAEADILVKQIKEFAEMGRAAGERDRRMLPEFANGVYMSPAFQAFRRRNGMLGGTFTGRDTLPSLLAPGEMVLNPRQMQAVRANAGFDVFKTAGIPGYANGGMAQSQPMSAGSLNVTIVVEQDAAGLWHATAQSDAGQKVIAKVVETKYANDELKMKRR